MRYGLIGERLGHSWSPELHRRIGSWPYELVEVAPDALGAFLEKRDFLGVNVTIPYKRAVIPYLDGLSAAARRIGAVNTVVNRGGRLFGDNTDFAGLLGLCRHAGIDMAGAKVLILGTGGAAHTARAAAEALGAAETVFVSRTGRGGAADYAEAASLHADAQIIVNATPVGTSPDEDASPIGLAPFTALRGVLDAVYNPLRTELVLDAADRGVPAEGGLYMLCAQAAAAGALFLNAPAGPAEPLFAALRAEKENAVLIGMPACGKTTVGKLLAERTGRAFFDTDELIARRTGMSPAEIITRSGEAAFRTLEREAVQTVCRERGSVIATGGGAVLEGANVRKLKRNGRLFFLDRPPEQLAATEDRPLSRDREKLMQMYRARLPVYRAAADETVAAAGTAGETADAIGERYAR